MPGSLLAAIRLCDDRGGFDFDQEVRFPQRRNAADETLNCLVRAIDRAKANNRFRGEVDPLELATQSWTIGHGLASLVATGPLPHQALAHGVPVLTALFTSAGDEPDRCRRSVEHGWAGAG
ncbi:WHG domain-containing protein [Streptomyces sp. CMB-StM0423]|uniref:WHG domain-containing protein n=1 Tax=Streptomyces sp. CMB-StM0423 TaxID=2059884 RepID=UPI001F3ACB8E|nr:WHG domain-containing protein [Streptomyces sp. CMB-StM0423]